MLKRDDVNLNTKNNLGYTSFMLACQFQPILALEMLKYNSIYFNLQNNSGYSGFMLACMEKPEFIIIPLLESQK